MSVAEVIDEIRRLPAADLAKVMVAVTDRSAELGGIESESSDFSAKARDAPKRNSLGLPTVCSSNTKNSSADWRCNHGWADADLADLAAKFPSLPPRPGPQSPAFFASPRGGVGPTYLHKRCHNIILAGQLGGPRGRGSWRWWLLIAWTTSLPLQR